MNFKRYLVEKNDSSVQILKFIEDGLIPLSPKFFEDNFREKEKYCFIAMKPNRADSIIKRQHKKNQMSTFTKFSNINIFWGADSLDWYNDYVNYETVVGVLKGKITLQGSTDLWTHIDAQGRRWIDIGELISFSYRYSTKTNI